MMINFSELSKKRKRILTGIGIVYLIGLIGASGEGLAGVVAWSLFAFVLTSIIFLWVK